MDENVKPLSDIPAINRFLSYCRIRTVPSKTVVIHAGDLPDVLYYIISGSVEVMIEDEEGNEMVLAYLNKGQFFGEMGLFYEQPTRSAWVRTRNACELAGNDLSALSPGRNRKPGPDLRARHAARDPAGPHQSQTRRSCVRGRHRTGRARDHGPVRGAGCDDAPGGHADQGVAPGIVAPGGLLTRNGRPGTQGARRPGTAARHRQDHRGVQCAPEDEDAPGDRAGQAHARPSARAPQGCAHR